MSKLTVVAGAQTGSEGKGAVAGYIVAQSGHNFDEVVNIRVGGPNAGHTVYGVPCNEIDQCTECDPIYGHPWRLRQVPVGAVTDLDSVLIIGPGSEIDEGVLGSEIEQLDRAGYNVSGRLLVDTHATILTKDHIDAEVERGLANRIGSTAKGIGAARVDRLWRTAKTVRDGIDLPVAVADTVEHVMDLANTYDIHVVIEGTQGYGLGLHTQFYPQTTSGDCRAIDFLAQAGLNPWADAWDEFEVVLVARTYPIRVAGNSGPMKGETDWATLGLPEERTTVTKKVRRVGTWDAEMVRAAVAASGGSPVVKLALTMADHMIPGCKDRSQAAALDADTYRMLQDMCDSIRRTCGAEVKYVGTGPNTIIEGTDKK